MSEWPTERQPWPGDDGQLYRDETPILPPPPSGYGQHAREQAREQPRPQEQYGNYQPPPPAPGMPAVYEYGQPRPYYQQVAPKNPALGVIASLFIPGLGSMIAGKAGKGVLILISYLVAWLTVFFLIGFVLAPAVWIWGMVAGYQDARKWNAAHGIIS